VRPGYRGGVSLCLAHICNFFTLAGYCQHERPVNDLRRLVRRRSWLLGFAIFFSLTPFSFLHTGGKTYCLFLESPVTAFIYGALAVVTWIVYAVMRSRSNSL
jgi:hypothetical protein